MQLIAVVLGAPTSAKRFSSARALLDYGFAAYKINVLAQKDEEAGTVKVNKGVNDDVTAVCANEYSELVKRNEADSAERRITLDESVDAPVKAGQKIGTMEFIRGGSVTGSIDLTASRDIEKKGLSGIIKDFLKMLV